MTHAAQTWDRFVWQGRFPERSIRWSVELQVRFDLGPRQDFERAFFRPAVGFEFARGASVWLGLAEVPQVSPRVRNEFRPYQQLLVEGVADGVTVVNRTRFEERTFDDVDGVTLRLGHQLRAMWPVLPGGGRLVGIGEGFFNLLATDPDVRGFDRFRGLVGVNVPVDAWALEAGYLLEIPFAHGRPTGLLNHVVVVSANLTLP